MKTKPMIGLMPLVDSEKDSYWMLPGYAKMIEQAGGIPIILPLTIDAHLLDSLFAHVDGLLFTGGHDVSPILSHVSNPQHCEELCPMRDTMESYLFSKCMAANKPMFGICRGVQLFNSLLGGTLYADLDTEHAQGINHRQPKPYEMPHHAVDLVQGAPLARLLVHKTIRVNSCHHQAIRTLAPALQPMAISEDGLVEAVYLPNAKFVQAVQWHPEFLYETDVASQLIAQSFVQACRGVVHQAAVS